MNASFLKKTISLLLVIGLFFVLHNLLFYTLNINTASFTYSLVELYLWFTLFTFVVVFVLLWVRIKSFDNVGMSFLLATSAKMLFCYLILRPLLRLSGAENTIEKVNFFGLFILFLLIETLFTIHLVNEKK